MHGGQPVKPINWVLSPKIVLFSVRGFRARNETAMVNV
jgi:hypothetical protein